MAGHKGLDLPKKVEYAKHLRPFGKKIWWSSVKTYFRSKERNRELRTQPIDRDTEPRMRYNSNME